MAYADQAGRARVDPQHPRAFAVCDSCGEWYNRVDLRPQMEWYGDNLEDTGYRMCYRCLSQPQPQLKTVILPEDPVPITDPRVEYFIQDQNLNGFVQNIGPQGTSINAAIVTFLNPDEPFLSAAAVLASSQTGWGLPQPTLTLTSGTITTSGVGQQVLAANTDRQYLLIYSPGAGLLATAQNGTPTLGIPASSLSNLLAPTPAVPAETSTVIVGTGQGLLQNAGATPPASVWAGSVWVLGLQQGQTYFVWEG